MKISNRKLRNNGVLAEILWVFLRNQNNVSTETFALELITASPENPDFFRQTVQVHFFIVLSVVFWKRQMTEETKTDAVAKDEQLSDEQLKEVSGGVNFDQLRRENLDKDASSLDEVRRENLEKD